MLFIKNKIGSLTAVLNALKKLLFIIVALIESNCDEKYKEFRHKISAVIMNTITVFKRRQSKTPVIP